MAESLPARLDLVGEGPRVVAREHGASIALLAVFAVALALRLAWIATLDDSLTWDDEREFAEVARHLAAGDGFVASSYRANPVLPLYLAGVFRLFGESFLAARIGQAVLGALTCGLVGLIARRLCGPIVGVLSALLVAAYPPHVYLSGVFYLECLFTFTVAATLALALRALEDESSLGWSFFTGIAFGVGALTRSVFLAYLPFLLMAMAFVLWPRWGRTLRSVALVLVGALAVVAPWSIRNYQVYGRPLFVSSGFGTKLWQGNNELTLGDADDRELYWGTPAWTERGRQLDDDTRRALDARYDQIGARVDALEAKLGDRYLATDRVLLPVAARYIADHPGRTASLFATKLVTLFAPFSKTLTQNKYTAWGYKLIASVAYFPLLLLAFAGLWLARREDRRLALLYTLLGSIVVAYGILNTCTRFRLPLDPFLIVFSAYALVRLRDAWLGDGASPRDAHIPTRA